MHNLFEQVHSLNEPIECFLFDAANEEFPVKPHWHYFAEFIYMKRGTVRMTANDQSFTASPGDLVLFPPSAVHSITAEDDTMPVFAAFKFDLGKFPSRSSYSPSPLSIFRYAQENGMPMHFPADTAAEMGCEEIFSGCIREIHSYQYGYDVMLRAQIYMLLYRIIRQWCDAGLSPEKCAAAESELYAVDRITEYIDSHLGEPLRVSELAERCHLSYSAFAVKFRERYGTGCKEYIERMRIFKAEEYLLFTDLDIGFISQETGFSDCSHFIKCFRQYRGITPKQFRMQRRNRS